MIGLRDPVFVSSLTPALTPAQVFVDAVSGQGGYGFQLPTALTYNAPVSSGATLIDALGGPTYTSLSAAGSPLLIDDGSGPNGRPYLSANGISQTLIGGVAETCACYTVAMRSPVTPFAGYGGPINTVGGPRAGFFAAGSTGWFTDVSSPLPRVVRKNGLDLVSPFDLAPITPWMILTVYLQSVPQGLLELFALENSYFAKLHLISPYKWATDPTSGQIAVVEAAFSAYTGIALSA